MAWQLETWFRTFVYVELRAARTDWEVPIKEKIASKKWPPDSLDNDKRLHHMATFHQAALSYITFGELWNIINDSNLWPLFESYFPPKKNTEVRIEEIKAIRNRIAHFREPHPQDVPRFELFLRDMESGVRNFCDRYSCNCRDFNDPVVGWLEANWDKIGYGVELWRPDDGWLYALGPHTRNPVVNARLEILRHSASAPTSPVGIIYKLKIRSAVRVSETKLNRIAFLDATKRLHINTIHIFLPEYSDEVEITIPAVLGTTKTGELIGSFLSAGLNCARDHFVPPEEVARNSWPEYVLWPENILTFYSSEITNPIIDLS